MRKVGEQKTETREQLADDFGTNSSYVSQAIASIQWGDSLGGVTVSEKIHEPLVKKLTNGYWKNSGTGRALSEKIHEVQNSLDPETESENVSDLTGKDFLN